MLRRLLKHEIHDGMTLPGNIHDDTGRVLVPAGTALTDQHIKRLGKRLVTGLYAGDDWPRIAPASPETIASITGEPLSASASEARTVSVEALRVGMRLSQNLYDPNGVLLLAAGSRITLRFLHLLQQRAIQFVQLVPPGVKASALVIDNQRPETSADAVNAGIVLKRELKLAELVEEARKGLECHAAASGLVGELCATLRDGKYVSADRLEGAVRDFFDMLTLDADLLGTIVGMQRSLGEYLHDHGVNVALLSMAIAAQRRCSHEQIMTIGLGAMLNDVGMTRVPASIRLATRPLSAVERAEIERHPIYTLEMLGHVSGLPNEVATIGFQTHERLDGSGYPRGRTANTLHPFSKIVAVADCYCAMIRPRPHRPGKLPHDAIKSVLQEGASGRLDRDVLRSFLDAISAFPIGTLVELNNGGKAQVIRANPGAHTRPIVAVVDGAGRMANGEINLADRSDLSVRRAFHLLEDTGALPA